MMRSARISIRTRGIEPTQRHHTRALPGKRGPSCTPRPRYMCSYAPAELAKYTTPDLLSFCWIPPYLFGQGSRTLYRRRTFLAREKKRVHRLLDFIRICSTWSKPETLRSATGEEKYPNNIPVHSDERSRTPHRTFLSWDKRPILVPHVQNRVLSNLRERESAVRELGEKLFFDADEFGHGESNPDLPLRDKVIFPPNERGGVPHTISDLLLAL
ncbi:hypothetical protein B0H14DRAFT_2705426 [Mycena olivaceomarginata]|nr:hypothetical protein B0H14DRAFT_2705426 [Mycena olivaceomarginata]